MSIFLFLKQIIDIFYGFKFGDYCMAIAALILILIQLYLNRPDEGEKIKIKLLVPDVCIIILSGIVLINFVIQLLTKCDFYIVYSYGKVGSGVLLYILGRLCFRRIGECSAAIKSASYIVVYSNLIYRIINYGANVFNEYNPDGDLYFYDTDMAFSILMSMIFISVLGKNTILKFFTIFAVCPFLVFHSSAGVQKILMVVLFVILFIYMGERAIKRRKYIDFILPIAMVGLIVVLFLLIMPVFTGNTNTILLKVLNSNIIGTESIYVRYESWRNIWSDFGMSGIKEMLIGNGVIMPWQTENQYIALLYSVGVVGLLAAIVFVLSISGAAMRIEDRPTYYITIMLAILFLGTCINKNGLEFTQMSWFTMMYFGMGAALSKKKDNLGETENVSL